MNVWGWSWIQKRRLNDAPENESGSLQYTLGHLFIHSELISAIEIFQPHYQQNKLDHINCLFRYRFQFVCFRHLMRPFHCGLQYVWLRRFGPVHAFKRNLWGAIHEQSSETSCIPLHISPANKAPSGMGILKATSAVSKIGSFSALMFKTYLVIFYVFTFVSCG